MAWNYSLYIVGYAGTCCSIEPNDKQWLTFEYLRHFHGYYATNAVVVAIVFAFNACIALYFWRITVRYRSVCGDMPEVNQRQPQTEMGLMYQQ